MAMLIHVAIFVNVQVHDILYDSRRGDHMNFNVFLLIPKISFYGFIGPIGHCDSA